MWWILVTRLEAPMILMLSEVVICVEFIEPGKSSFKGSRVQAQKFSRNFIWTVLVWMRSWSWDHKFEAIKLFLSWGEVCESSPDDARLLCERCSESCRNFNLRFLFLELEGERREVVKNCRIIRGLKSGKFHHEYCCWPLAERTR